MTVAQGQLIVSIIGVFFATSAAVVAWRTFIRAERWKQAEFLALVMQEFTGDERVQKALTMIDWGLRRIPLLDETAPDGGNVEVSRWMQTLALRPHPLQEQQSSEASSHGYFNSADGAIRDCYDALLDRLERLGNYIKTKLITTSNLEPYIEYWINDIYERSDYAADAAWRASLLAYIDFYRFRGVQYLFEQFGKPIGPASKAFSTALSQMEDRGLAEGLEKCVREPGKTTP